MRSTPSASRRWENSPSTKPGAIQFPSSAEELLQLSVVLRQRSELGVGPFDAVSTPLAAGVEGSLGVLQALLAADLLRISPDTPLESLDWADGSSDFPATFSPLRAAFQVPGRGQIHERVDVWLDELPSVELQSLPRRYIEQLPELIVRVILGEVHRYLEFKLSEVSLPSPTQEQWSYFSTSVSSRIGPLSLGRLYSVVWSSVRAGTHAKQQYRQRPATSTQTVINAITRGIDAALEHDRYLEPFQLDLRVPLGQVSSLLLRKVLGVDPASTSIDEMLELLNIQLEQVPTLTWGRDFAWFDENRELWQPLEVLSALYTVAESADTAEVARTASIAASLDRRLSMAGLDDQSRAIAVMHALVLGDVGAMHGSAVLARVRELVGEEELGEPGAALF